MCVCNIDGDRDRDGWRSRDVEWDIDGVTETGRGKETPSIDFRCKSQFCVVSPHS